MLHAERAELGQGQDFVDGMNGVSQELLLAIKAMESL
jgi:hypothetical protein